MGTSKSSVEPKEGNALSSPASSSQDQHVVCATRARLARIIEISREYLCRKGALLTSLILQGSELEEYVSPLAVVCKVAERYAKTP